MPSQLGNRVGRFPIREPFDYEQVSTLVWHVAPLFRYPSVCNLGGDAMIEARFESLDRLNLTKPDGPIGDPTAIGTGR